MLRHFRFTLLYCMSYSCPTTNEYIRLLRKEVLDLKYNWNIHFSFVIALKPAK